MGREPQNTNHARTKNPTNQNQQNLTTTFGKKTSLWIKKKKSKKWVINKQ